MGKIPLKYDPARVDDGLRLVYAGAGKSKTRAFQVDSERRLVAWNDGVARPELEAEILRECGLTPTAPKTRIVDESPPALTEDGYRKVLADLKVKGASPLGPELERVATEGRKDDQSKPPLHLIAPDFLYALAEILDFGAKKYAPRNWEKGMDWSRVYRAAIGHLFDWFMRKGGDPETGKSHLWHAACCVMFLVCYEIRAVGTDDRPPPA